MIREFFRELSDLIKELRQVMSTREFWIYFGVILLMLVMAAAVIRLATGFDPITRAQLQMSFSCQTGQGQMATIIVGCFVFSVACVFTLGEVINWVEETRMSRERGHEYYKVDYWRALWHVLGTVALGVGGYFLLLSWCT